MDVGNFSSFRRGRGGPINWQYDDYHVEDDSDGVASSSEDEIDILLRGTPEQKRKLRRKSLQEDNESSEDEFEKQMKDELNDTVRELESRRDLVKKPKPKKGVKLESTTRTRRQDSSDDEIHTEEISNDDLLYDPEADDADQAWVDAQRREDRLRSQPDSSKNSSIPLGSTDAVLSCPCCMVTLCRDCQRHEIYENQYRAMFVSSNCRIDRTQRLHVAEKLKGSARYRRNRKRKANSEPEPDSETTSQQEKVSPVSAAGQGLELDTDYFHPVHCTECNTEVAVYDKDDVFHFFHVLTSYG